MKRNLNKNFKKTILSIVVLMIVSSSIYCQNRPENLEGYSKIDTNQINDLYYIGLSLKKEIADNDSLKLELKKANEIISLQSNLIGQNNDVKADLKKYIKTLDNNYQSLEKDYEKLKKGKFLKGLIGGGVSVEYNLLNSNINNTSINLNLGFILKEKYSTIISVGVSLNNSLIFGLNENIIF